MGRSFYLILKVPLNVPMKPIRQDAPIPLQLAETEKAIYCERGSKRGKATSPPPTGRQQQRELFREKEREREHKGRKFYHPLPYSNAVLSKIWYKTERCHPLLPNPWMSKRELAALRGRHTALGAKRRRGRLSNRRLSPVRAERPLRIPLRRTRPNSEGETLHPHSNTWAQPEGRVKIAQIT